MSRVTDLMLMLKCKEACNPLLLLSLSCKSWPIIQTLSMKAARLSAYEVNA